MGMNPMMMGMGGMGGMGMGMPGEALQDAFVCGCRIARGCCYQLSTGSLAAVNKALPATGTAVSLHQVLVKRHAVKVSNPSMWVHVD